MKEKIEEFIVNVLGINLVSVKSIDVEKQNDGQIKSINIEFIPE